MSLQEPTKQVVTIDVGSKYEFIWSEDDIEELTVTKIEGDKVYDDKGGYLLKETLQGLDENKDDIASINGIPRDQIAEVRFDDQLTDSCAPEKITLKIGDELIYCKGYKSSESIGQGCLEDIVTKIKNGKVYGGRGDKYNFSNPDNYWYVNGKVFHKNNIIVPGEEISIQGSPEFVNGEPEVMYEPVTPETFVKMLEYNNYKYHMTTDAGRVIYKYDNRDVTLPSPDKSSVWADTYSVSIGGCFKLNTDFWEDVINIIIPKLGLKPVPVFDFKQYLVDNGFNTESIHEGFDWFIAGKRRIIKVWGANGGYYTNQRIAIKPTKENADILIRMNNLAKEIEHA